MDARVVTFVFTGQDGQCLEPLTSERPKALLPVGAVFRVLDFAISNALNSQLRHIYVVAGQKPDCIESYLREAWPQLSRDFRADLGQDMRYLTDDFPAPGRSLEQAVLAHWEAVEESLADHILVISGDQIYRLDYSRMIRQHLDTESDVTELAAHCPINCGVMAVLYRREFLKTAAGAKARPRRSSASSKERRSTFSYSGRFCDLSTIDSYYRAQLDLLSPSAALDPFAAGWPIRPLSGTKLLQSSRYAQDSWVALGARLTLCHVAHSIICAGARIEPDARVENSVVLSGCRIGAGATVRNAVIGENVDVPAKAIVGGDSSLHLLPEILTPQGIVVVPPSDLKRQYVQKRSPRVPMRPDYVVRR